MRQLRLPEDQRRKELEPAHQLMTDEGIYLVTTAFNVLRAVVSPFLGQFDIEEIGSLLQRAGKDVILDHVMHPREALPTGPAGICVNIPNPITAEFLRLNPGNIFVFGDNLQRTGKGGAAAMRDEPNTYGFITKKAPNNLDESFFTIEQYRPVFVAEFALLVSVISATPRRTFLVTKLGGGLANRYNIYETVIEPALKMLATVYGNVILLP